MATSRKQTTGELILARIAKGLCVACEKPVSTYDASSGFPRRLCAICERQLGKSMAGNSQPQLFDTAPTERTAPSALCCYDPYCQPRGVMAIGPDDVRAGCINRALRCLKCGRTGVESENTEARPGA